MSESKKNTKVWAGRTKLMMEHNQQLAAFSRGAIGVLVHVHGLAMKSLDSLFLSPGTRRRLLDIRDLTGPYCVDAARQEAKAEIKEIAEKMKKGVPDA